MPLTIHQFPCLSDNYGFLVRDVASGKVACIDTPDADAIIAEAERLGWGIDMVLNTHWHPDHAGGNAAIKARFGAELVGPQEVLAHYPLDRTVGDGDAVDLGGTRFAVIDTGGHTLGHICYHDADDGVAFVGDTLFPLGCGRLFEGTAQQMWDSLSRLAALPPQTVAYSAHEYTLSNGRFAVTVDDSPALAARMDQVRAARDRGEPTVPTTIGAERETNPFLRAPLLRAGSDPAAAFAEIRALKDNFKG
ncbi:hydroxyacylglutathione hydrolase [Caenibius tardaugens NBRC 16725]|uniref:Hydroxyacylglutathione hydrolase n=1 Tax=Caenibius tardaugens NBRC 16725 TaxID=1219035 RepID=U2ZTT9_9SPHN|nr:hydroxyacylglutathione hydrolase [Caenibius tardaugens]AZI36127.1 hydroxyacylglutathione hydrolase [Caenibius tardaugens NBRC 16725]GAD48789.1 hydroxyacylglutathione hydrolase [Caenibius tardaugens NBRC 16725]